MTKTEGQQMNHTMETYKNNTSAACGTVLSQIQTTAGTARLRPYGFLFLFLTLLGLFAGILPATALSGAGTSEDPWGVTTWSELCEKMKVEYDAYIRLDNDVIFGTGGGQFQNDALEISSNTNVHIHLNLNGHRIDRNLKNLSAVENGYVIKVPGGTLSLSDDSNEKTGTITGGKNTGNGGGVYVGGAYQLRPDGTKEYLIFQTYDICMAYLGRDELCRGPERCYHK
ncbi:MAG: hypothetical protein IJI57_15760 [Flexilinea sp.]|nr:hypothetical protein [Flexilinea sp.]